METAVRVRGLTFGYDRRPVLEDIDLDIHAGDYLGLVGPNGAAKTTLIRLILNLLRPWRGEICLFGTPVHSFRDWERVGYVSQRATAFNTSFPATVREVVTAALSSQMGLLRRPSEKHLARVQRALEVVGMQDHSGRLIGNLSGGQMQRVFIARSLVSSPEIIFLDEPTVGIDIEARGRFYGLLDRLNREMGITIVLISHDIGLITEKVTRIACMGNGRLAAGEGEHIMETMGSFYGDGIRLLLHNH